MRRAREIEANRLVLGWARAEMIQLPNGLGSRIIYDLWLSSLADDETVLMVQK